jgi:hypothetical protein
MEWRILAGTRVTIVTPSQEPTWGLPDARLLAIVNEKLEQLGVTVVRNRVMREVDTQVKARLSSCACVRAPDPCGATYLPSRVSARGRGPLVLIIALAVRAVASAAVSLGAAGARARGGEAEPGRQGREGGGRGRRLRVALQQRLAARRWYRTPPLCSWAQSRCQPPQPSCRRSEARSVGQRRAEPRRA